MSQQYFKSSSESYLDFATTKNNYYAVVEFVEEWENGTVPMAIVSSLWLKHKTNNTYCYWPNYFCKDSERIKAMKDHVTPDISKCGLSLVSIKYKTESYPRAVTKLKRLEDESTVSETDVDNNPTKNRKHHPNKYLQDFVDQISSSDGEEIPIPPNVTVDTSKNVQKNINPNLAKAGLQMSSNSISSSIIASAPVSINKHLHSQQTCYNCKVNEDLLKEIMQAVSNMSKDIHYLTRLVQNSQIGDNLQPNVELDVFPVSSLEDMENLNRNLESVDFLNALSTTLQTVGGKDVVDTTRRVLGRIISHDLSLLYNWSGRNKKCFSQLGNIIKLILVSVRKNPLSKSATQLEIEAVIKVWLRSAPDREGGRMKRSKPKPLQSV